MQVGGHAIEVVGWGEENGDKFWWVKNSWTANWGINGYFKIGINECGMPDMGEFGCPEPYGCKDPVGPTPPSDKTKSCEGKCGSVVIDPFGNELCSCDDVCQSNGNCCNDFVKICNPGPAPTPTPTPTPKKLTC